MKKKSFQTFLAGLLATTMLFAGSGCSGSGSDETTASDSGDTAYSLNFPSDDYTSKTVTVSTSAGSKISYYTYQDVAYVTDPVDADYESMNAYAPYELDGSSVSTAQPPILLNVGVGDVTGCSHQSMIPLLIF